MLYIIRESFLCWHWKVELKLGGQFFFGVQSVGEVDSTNAAVGVDLTAQHTKHTSSQGVFGFILGAHPTRLP